MKPAKWSNPELKIFPHQVGFTAPPKDFDSGISPYQLGGNVAAVTSVRQASIPLSVVGAALILKEPSMGRRLCWAMVLTTGIVVIITSG